MAAPLTPAMGGAPPMGSSPMAVPTGNAGSMAHAKSQLRAAYEIFIKALPAFTVGCDDHKQLLSVMTTLNKLAPASAEVPGVQQTTAAGLNADAQKSAAMAMLKPPVAPAGASAGGGGAPPGPPSPAMPPSLAA